MAGTTVINRYKDLDISLERNPKTGDIYTLKDIEAVKRSVKLLVLTNIFERPFHPEISSSIYASLFENIDDISASVIKDEIKNTIRNYEPRVDLIDVIIDPDYDNNNFNVTVQYNIVGIDVLPQQLSFALQPTR